MGVVLAAARPEGLAAASLWPSPISSNLPWPENKTPAPSREGAGVLLARPEGFEPPTT